MTAWIKFFFGGFFVNKFAIDGVHRSVWNAVFAAVICLALIYFGLYAGYSVSFGHHVNNCTPLVDIVGRVFDGNIVIEIDRGKAVSGISGKLDNSFVVNTYSVTADKAKYSVDDYNLIVDTRPRATTYDDFTVVCASKIDGDEISYKQYKELSDSAKGNYAVRIIYSGNALGLNDERLQEYKSYLDKCSDETDSHYDNTIASEYTALASDDSNGLYELYIKAYCPEAYGTDKYGVVPTVRSFYVDNFLSDKDDDKYLAIFDDSVVGNFVTDKRIPVSFGGYYIKLDGLTADTKESGINFIVRAVKSASGVDLNIYLINLLRIIPVFIIVPFVLALAIWAIDKAVKSESFLYLGETIKTVFSFMLISGVITFAAEILFSFVLSRDTVYSLSIAIFSAIMLVRSATLALPRYIYGRKQKRSQDLDDKFFLGDNDV